MCDNKRLILFFTLFNDNLFSTKQNILINLIFVYPNTMIYVIPIIK